MSKVIDIHERIRKLEAERNLLRFAVLETIRMIHTDEGYCLKDTWWHPSGGTMVEFLIGCTGMTQDEVIETIMNLKHLNFKKK